MILNVFVPIMCIATASVAFGFLTYWTFGDNIKDEQGCDD